MDVSKHNLFFAAGDILKCSTFDPFTHVYMFDIGTCVCCSYYLCVPSVWARYLVLPVISSCTLIRST